VVIRGFVGDSIVTARIPTFVSPRILIDTLESCTFASLILLVRAIRVRVCVVGGSVVAIGRTSRRTSSLSSRRTSRRCVCCEGHNGRGCGGCAKQEGRATAVIRATAVVRAIAIVRATVIVRAKAVVRGRASIRILHMGIIVLVVAK
jgi:hypothetical protein